MTVLTACNKNIEYKMTDEYADETEHLFETLLTSTDTLSSTCEELYMIEKPVNAINSSETLPTIQGGTSDGVYYYQAFIKKDALSKEADNIVRIVKFEIETGKIVSTSDNLLLNHANDITYNSKNNELIVVHNAPNHSLVSILDPDSLTIKESKNIGFGIYCLDYNETRDEYVVGLSGGQCFQVLNSDFTIKSSIFQPIERTTGFTTQGCSSDDNFIYFVLYTENVITVYDWSGDFITLIKLNVGSLEPENVCVFDNKIYVGCSALKGAKLFEVTPIAETE